MGKRSSRPVNVSHRSVACFCRAERSKQTYPRRESKLAQQPQSGSGNVPHVSALTIVCIHSAGTFMCCSSARRKHHSSVYAVARHHATKQSRLRARHSVGYSSDQVLRMYIKHSINGGSIETPAVRSPELAAPNRVEEASTGRIAKTTPIQRALRQKHTRRLCVSLLSGTSIVCVKTGAHLHLGCQKQAGRPHEKTLVPVERVQHVKLVEENQRRGDRVDRPAGAEAETTGATCGYSIHGLKTTCKRGTGGWRLRGVSLSGIDACPFFCV